MTPNAPDPAAGNRTRNRIVVSAFGLAALIFILGPIAWIQWNARDFCPAEVKAGGRSSGTDWEVTRSDCGAQVGVVWQLRIIPTKGVSHLAYEARAGGPEPVGYEQKGFEGTVRLAAPPPGAAEPSVVVKLDHRGRPEQAVRFAEGRRVE